MAQKLLLTITGLFGLSLAIQGSVTLAMPGQFFVDGSQASGLAITATANSFSISNNSGSTARAGGIGQLAEAITLTKAGAMMF